MSLSALAHHNETHSFRGSSQHPHSRATRLASLSNKHVAFLHAHPDGATVNVMSLTAYNSDSSIKPESIQVPSDAHTLLSAHDVLAVIGARSLTIIDHPLSPSPITRQIAAPLFASRPALTVTHAAWVPYAPAFLLVLTSDATLRLYDVISRDDVSVERLRLRVVTNACSPPVYFSFGRSSVSWDALSVYVLTQEGDIYVVAPLTPIGTRLSHTAWSKMRSAAAARKQQTEDSWPVRQADMQLHFLDDVFERSSTGDMIAVREFKPAPLLFQGPLFVEHDDTNEPSSTPTTTQTQQNIKGEPSYTSLTVLNCGADISPILLRVSSRGDISVLIATEPLEAQWFLSAEPTVVNEGITSDAIDTDQHHALAASEEYASCAAQVAPSLLCFEHISLDNSPVSILPLGSTTHADVVFVATPFAVYSLRLTFVSFLSDAAALERSACSVLSRILSTELLVENSQDAEPEDSRVVGLVSHYERMTGPIGIALTADCCMHVTAPLRWVSHSNTAVLPPSVSPPLRSQALDASSGRKFACVELGKEAVQLLKAVSEAERQAGGFVADGTLGIAITSANSSRVLKELERRVALYTGGNNSGTQGVSDCLGELSVILTTWAGEVATRAKDLQSTCTEEITQAIDQIAISEANTRRKLDRVNQVGSLLEERMRTLMTVVDAAKVELTPAEAARLQSLRDRSRRLTFFRGRLKELTVAVQASRSNLVSNVTRSTVPDIPGRGSPAPSSRRSSMSAGRLRPSPSPSSSPFKNPSPARRLSFAGNGGVRNDAGDGPLAKKRAEWAESWMGRPTLNSADMQRLRIALEKHSQEIAHAMELESSLRKKLSVS